MVVVMRPGTSKQDIDALVNKLKEQNLEVGVTNGIGCTILGLVGDTTAVDMDKISINPHVERVMRVQEPYKKANRKFHPEDTVVSVGNAKIGGGNFLGHRRALLGGERGADLRRGGGREAVGGRPCSGGAPSSPAHPPTPSRAWAPPAWTC